MFPFLFNFSIILHFPPIHFCFIYFPFCFLSFSYEFRMIFFHKFKIWIYLSPHPHFTLFILRFVLSKFHLLSPPTKQRQWKITESPSHHPPSLSLFIFTHSHKQKQNDAIPHAGSSKFNSSIPPPPFISSFSFVHSFDIFCFYSHLFSLFLLFLPFHQNSH